MVSLTSIGFSDVGDNALFWLDDSGDLKMSPTSNNFYNEQRRLHPSPTLV